MRFGITGVAASISGLRLIHAAIAAFAGWSAAGAAIAQSQPSPEMQPRIVAPQLIAPPDVKTDDLQRVEPRPPLNGTLQQGSDIKPQATPKLQPATKLLKADPLLFKPVAEAAGKINAEGRIVTIAGVEGVPVDRMCGEDGASWPCGMIARTAFRSFLRGRAVRCDFPDGDVPQEVTAACRVGNKDIAEWLLANGWAEISAGNETESYQELAKQAEAGKKGIYGSAPRALSPALTNNPVSPSAQLRPLGNISILPPLELAAPEQPSAETEIQPPPPGPMPTAPPSELLPAPSSPQPQ